MIHFINTSEGIREEHQKQTPLFEKEFIPSVKSPTEVTRLYKDGTLYFLKISAEEKGKEQWGASLRITKLGMEKIGTLLKHCCNLDSDDIKNGNYMGLVIWRVWCNNEIIELVTTLVPASKHVIFNEIQELVNHNIKPVAKD